MFCEWRISFTRWSQVQKQTYMIQPSDISNLLSHHLNSCLLQSIRLMQMKRMIMWSNLGIALLSTCPYRYTCEFSLINPFYYLLVVDLSFFYFVIPCRTVWLTLIETGNRAKRVCFLFLPWIFYLFLLVWITLIIIWTIVYSFLIIIL